MLARNKDVQRAELLLQKMHREYEACNKLVQPTTITYNAVLIAWARSASKDAGVHACGLLRRM